MLRNALEDHFPFWDFFFFSHSLAVFVCFFKLTVPGSIIQNIQISLHWGLGEVSIFLKAGTAGGERLV